MFIESRAQESLKLWRSETLGLFKGTLRSFGAKEIFSATWAINVWPLCG